MLAGTKAKNERRKYARAEVECPVKITLETGGEYNEVTEEISYLGFHFHCDLDKAMSILPDGLNNLSLAGAMPCLVEFMPDQDDAMTLQAQVESMSRLSQNAFKVAIRFDDATVNFNDYQKFKSFIETRVGV